ncbi:glycosyltransferase family 2 protein [Flavisolibacter sp. BT320]|nr:glycosyltransferase family 2 protein [Flavisolibacter longurius]
MYDVTVWMTAYNHEKYIAAALDSVLNQQTSHTFEIVLGEDFSTDGTRAVVLEYHAKYPGKFRLLLPEKNMGMIPMFKATYEMCTGKYLAFLDGDDYWTDPLKLQKQVDFLEANPDYSFCFHKVQFLEQSTGVLHEPYSINEELNRDTLTVEDFIADINPVDTLSVVMRNVLGPTLPDWYYELPFPDLGIYFLLLQQGKAKYLNETMGVYRVHGGGAWSGASEYNNQEKHIRFFESIKKNLPYTNSKKLDAAIQTYARFCFKNDIRKLRFKDALRHWKTMNRHKS